MSSPGFPVVMSATGAIPTPPSTLLSTLLGLVAASNPGYTANLPGSLIEDISSTDVGALTLIDTARVDTINSLTPFGANLFLLNQLGQIYLGKVSGAQGQATTTSVLVVFEGTPGFSISAGFVVTDGTNQYSIPQGGIIGAASIGPLGVSQPLLAVGVQSGTWAVPANTVNTLISSVPSTITLSVNNPNTGTPGSGPESNSNYRARVLQAGLAIAQGMPTFLRTLLEAVPGVQARLVSIRSAPISGDWEVIVGGGDPYEIAYAIFTGVFDITTVVGSTLLATNITASNPGTLTSNLNHGFTTGQVVQVSNSNPPNYNGTYTITVVDEKTFTLGVDTTGFPAYVGGATVTPNLRNVTATVIDYPDQYSITFVSPPQQTVGMVVTWNTSLTNSVSGSSVSAAASTALASYVNSVPVGQPLNVLAMQAVFTDSIANIIPISFVTDLAFSVTINGLTTLPTPGTNIIEGDPESFFFTTADQIAVNRS